MFLRSYLMKLHDGFSEQGGGYIPSFHKEIELMPKLILMGRGHMESRGNSKWAHSKSILYP